MFNSNLRLFDSFLQVQEEPEDSVRRSSYKLHQNCLEHFQTSDQVKTRIRLYRWSSHFTQSQQAGVIFVSSVSLQPQVWEEADICELPG